MAGPFDLTGQNIENTYPRILQTPDGVNVYDGTGSAFTFTAVAVPEGPNTSIQFNGNGLFSGSSNFTFNSASNALALTGSLNISGSIIMNSPTASIAGVDYIDFDTQHIIGTNEPSWKEGRLFYDSGSGALAFYNWEQEVTLNIGQEQWLKARNQTGVTITNGSVVRLSGAIGDRPTIVLAQSTDQTNIFSTVNDIIGMATHDIENGTDGFVTTFGLVNGLNTSAFTAGDLLWVSQSAGHFTNIPPPVPFDKTFVGIVTRKNANNGTVFVTPSQPIHFHDISSVSASIYQQGDLWMYRSGSVGQANAWINTKTLGGNYTISGSLTITGSLTTNDGVNVQTITASFVSASSITGSLFGTSSWATNAQTSSYISSSNVYGPNGFDSVNYATSAGSAASATNVTSPLTQDLLIDGKFTTQLNSTKLANLAQNLHYYTGHTVYGIKDSGVSIGDLVYLETDNIWYQVIQTNSSSTKMLGIWVDDTTGYVLLEGDIVLDASYINSPNYGLPLFISGSARFTSRPDVLTSGYIRAVGHPYYYYTDGLSTFNWILRFKPSNDWVQI